MRKYILFLVILAGVGYLGYMRFVVPGMMMPGGPGGAVPVSVAEVIERDVLQWHEFSGRLVAVDQAEIRPQVSGIVESVHFEDGAQVNKGDLLFVIDPRPFEAALQAANARFVLADSELARASALLKDKAISQRDYDQRKNAAAVARADLLTAKLNLDYTKIKAPIAGKVSRAEVTVGNLVEAGMNAPLLTTVVANNNMYADFEIDEATYLKYAHGGATGKDAQIPVVMELESASLPPREGRVESFDNRLNPASGTLRVRAVFDNTDGLLVPGLFARIKLGSAGMQKAVLITDRAIGTDQNKKFVLVVGADGKAEHREVKLGSRADGLRIVNEGLKPGEKIVVSGLQRVMMPGQPVTPETVPMEEKAPAAGTSAAPPPEAPASDQPAATEAKIPEPAAQ